MNWYNKYLKVYDKPLSQDSQEVIADVGYKLQLLQSKEPLATVSVIAYNEEKHLLACLWSLSEMECKYPIEIIGVNNDSKDLTEDIFKALNMPYYNEYQHSCGYARRCGLEHAKGKYHINIDADTMYPPHYIETMINELEKPGIVAVSSLWSYIQDKKHSRVGLKLYELSRDLYLFLQSFKRPELSVRGLVFAYNTEHARKVGIRVDIIRGEDGSLALGLKKYGKIAFIQSKKARAVTGYGTVGANLLTSFSQKFVRSIKNIGRLFSQKEKYRDKKDNLIK
ncbi:glycosyltransferase family 2 protein [uncultured Bacteroides sp.]|uniref:glycosyltransferase family 2 protein n=1 Tax=uncultured Bacteroides sp. TaxID=162156 RepID=UPI002AA92189|nr:glycosyltransferase family 2 protein [uncultured Bacteroides sp.]